MTIQIEGMKELIGVIKRLEELPQECVSKAVKEGALISKSAAKHGGWLDQTGMLRRGISLKAERDKKKGKKFYQVRINPKMNNVFVKETKSGKRYYYPASQEYGFRTKNGGYVPGFNYLKSSIIDNKSKIEKTIVDVLSKEIDKLK